VGVSMFMFPFWVMIFFEYWGGGTVMGLAGVIMLLFPFFLACEFLCVIFGGGGEQAWHSCVLVCSCFLFGL
jgi:hypothetical protein